MLPNMPPAPQLTKKERKLCQYYKGLNENDRHALLSFASFLATNETVAKTEEKAPELQLPLEFEVVENESVVKGIKRLKASYFMIDDNDLLHQVSALMQEHIMQGVPASEIIPRVEQVFQVFYEQYKGKFS